MLPTLYCFFFCLWYEWWWFAKFCLFDIFLFFWVQAVLVLIYVLKWSSMNIFIKICLDVMKIDLVFRLLRLCRLLLCFLLFFALLKYKIIDTYFFIFFITIFVIYLFVLFTCILRMVPRWVWNNSFRKLIFIWLLLLWFQLFNILIILIFSVNWLIFLWILILIVFNNCLIIMTIHINFQGLIILYVMKSLSIVAWSHLLI